MKKKFNTTGVCIPEKHYMVDVSGKLDKMFALIEQGDYFVINRPRQYGKTTVLSLLERELQQQPDYLPVFISFEGFDTESYTDAWHFTNALLDEFRLVFEYFQQDDLLNLCKQGHGMTTLHQFGNWITELVNISCQHIVLMIDEVDKSSNHQLFLDFLAVLRSKYLWAARGKDVTFHSVILAGVHDVKTLKLKLRPDDDRKYNSPWNIAVDFTVDLSFSSLEIQTMLAEYCNATGVTMDQAQIAKLLHHYTSGYPFLVSALCKIIAEEFPREGSMWQEKDIDMAANTILFRQNTNFESLIKNLENISELYALVERLILSDEQIDYNEDNALIHIGLLYGMFARSGTRIAIHNRIYRERIYNYMALNLKLQEISPERLTRYTFQDQFLLPDQSLDMERVLLKFQEFMKQEYRQRDTTFIERNGRLIFLGFLRPIINGRGYAFTEPQISEEKRLDIAVTYNHCRYVIELKIWRGDKAHQDGLRQLRDYLERTGCDTGYLIIFDFTRKGQKTWNQDRIQVEQKTIFAVWV
ncbi:MAG: AAA family ATPase [Desulfobacterales bacterium]|nr:AAA family ATPase [Desulfobacterales bacterium]